MYATIKLHEHELIECVYCGQEIPSKELYLVPIGVGCDAEWA